MKKLVFLVVMALLVSAVHAVTMPLGACASAQAASVSAASHHHGCDDGPASSQAGSTAQHTSAMAHACCTGMCPQSEPWVFQAFAPQQPLAPSPVLGTALGLASAIFKPPKSLV